MRAYNKTKVNMIHDLFSKFLATRENKTLLAYKMNMLHRLKSIQVIVVENAY